MNAQIKKMMVVVFSLLSFLILLIPNKAQEGNVFAEDSPKNKNLKIAFGTQLPPYVIREIEAFPFIKLPPYVIPEEGMGMEMDIVRQALKEEGYTLEPVFLRHQDIKKELEETPVDGISPCNEDAGIEKVFYTDSHINYQNMAITSKDAKFKIKTLSDLTDKKIYAFQNAKLYLGSEFKSVVENNPNYLEIPLRGQHMNAALINKDSVIIIDKNIFNYYLASHIVIGNNIKNNFTYNEIFPPTPYKVAFYDESVRDAFNRGLAKIKKEGKYQRIIEKYELLMQKRIEEAEREKNKR